MKNYNLLKDMIREWGVTKVVETLVNILREGDRVDRDFAEDLSESLGRYKRRRGSD